MKSDFLGWFGILLGMGIALVMLAGIAKSSYSDLHRNDAPVTVETEIKSSSN